MGRKREAHSAQTEEESTTFLRLTLTRFRYRFFLGVGTYSDSTQTSDPSRTFRLKNPHECVKQSKPVVHH